LIVSLDDLRVASEEHQLETWDGLTAKLAQVRQMLGSGLDDAAALFLWAIFDGAMRRLALTTGKPVERLPEFEMMNELYTLGVHVRDRVPDRQEIHTFTQSGRTWIPIRRQNRCSQSVRQAPVGTRRELAHRVRPLE
jgi:hypothetical protein